MDTTRTSPVIIAIGGYAQVGKDTFFHFLKQHARKNWGLHTHKWKFADGLREEVRAECLVMYGIDPHTEIPEEKEKIRPILIRAAVQRREEDPDYWANLLFSTKMPYSGIVGITDLRYINEKRIIEAQEVPYHFVWINRPGYGPANDEEKKNTKILEHSLSHDINTTVVTWPVDLGSPNPKEWDKEIVQQLSSYLEKKIFPRIEEALFPPN
jgi:hypothetical protein